MSISTRIEAVQESLEKYSNEFDNDMSKIEEFSKIVKEIAPNTTDADTVEIIFRGLLEKFLSSSSSREALLKPNGDILSLIKFTLAFGPYVSTATSSSPSSSLSDTGLVSMAKMPYLLIEDMLESLSIKNAESAWGIVETLIFDYTTKHPEFLARGNITILSLIIPSPSSLF